MDGNIPGGNFLGGSFPGGNLPRTVTSNLFQTLSYVSWDSKPGFVLSLFLNFLPKLIKTCCYKIVHIKKSVYRLHFLHMISQKELKSNSLITLTI